jgi:hypothetical protein
VQPNAAETLSAKSKQEIEIYTLINIDRPVIAALGAAWAATNTAKAQAFRLTIIALCAVQAAANAAKVRPFRLVIAALCAALAGCGSADPVAYSGIMSSSQLAPNPRDDSGRIPYRYSVPVDWGTYNRIIIDPVVIYRGADQQFGDMSEDDKAGLAGYMPAQFAEKLRTRFTLASNPAPNTLRVRLTLTGASTNTPVLSTFTHFDLAGGLYNGVQAVRGGEGALSGSVIYAVEIYDAPTNRLLSAFITKQYPGPLNIVASMGSLAAAKTGIEKGADALVTMLK